MAAHGLWLRWSWRDLRRRWPTVAAIALIIAVGTGVYAGFSSMATWRRTSNDRNYAQQNMYDLRVQLSAGTFAPAGSLRAAVDSTIEAGLIEQSEERLIVPVQVNVATAGEDILVHGEIVGLDLAGGGPQVNQIRVARGQPMEATASGANVAILHTGFARANHLPEQGTLRVGGSVPLEYAGHGVTPEYFVITSRAAGYVPLGNLAHYAVLFTSLPTAQAVTGRTGMVNDLVLTLVPGADRTAVRDRLAAALAVALPDVSATVLATEDDEGYRVLYEDIDNDQQLVTILALLVLGGAALAAFNLSSRLVEAQRREIGVGMALGVPPSRLAIRPLLFGAQVAILGVLLSVPVGLLVGQAMKPILSEMVPLPVWQTPFEFAPFARAAAAGFVLPFLATIYPVMRSVRMQPVDAIRVGFLAGGSGGLAPLLRRIPLPGRSITQMPLRNLVRTPRRTLLTALAISGALTALIGTLGLIDTFNHTIDRGSAETLRSAPDRLDVQLDFFYPTGSEFVEAIATAPVTAEADFGLRLEGIAVAGAIEAPLMIDVLPFSEAMWRPSISNGTAPGSSEIVLSEKAASDLGLQPGDTVTLRHPRREGYGYRMTETPVVVAGTHPGPLRFLAYMDASAAPVFGLEGLVNYAQLRPAPDASADSVRRALFGRAGVAHVQPVHATADQLEEAMSQFYSILTIGVVAALAITLLISFNATSIATDERAREHATMFAFGLPLATVLRANVIESTLVGMISVAVGLPAGYFVLSWIVRFSTAETLPEFDLQPVLAPTTLVIAILIGVVAVAAGPLFAMRRLRNMDIPATLRVVE